MLTGEFDIRELDVDGKPNYPGYYLLFIDGGGAFVTEVAVQDIEWFDECFDGLTWWFEGEYVIGYIPLSEMEELFD